MSHISVMKVVFADRALLVEALKNLGYTLNENEGQRITTPSKSVPVEFSVEIPGSDSIGFRHTNIGWQLTADWFRVQINRKKFENQLKQKYAYLSVMKSLGEQGFLLDEESREGNEIRLVLRRFS